MNHYIIDGNNLIGKIKELNSLSSAEKQLARERIIHLLNRFFAGRKINLSLHLDGFPKNPLSLTKGKIIYSGIRQADAKIKEEIENSKNPRLIILVSSDQGLINYARAYSAAVVKSEDFLAQINKAGEKDDEEIRLKELEKEKNFFLKLFEGKS